MESPRLPKVVSQYIRVVVTAVDENNPSLIARNYTVHLRFTNANVLITFTKETFYFLKMATCLGLRGENAQPTAPVVEQGQPTGVEPHPDQAAVGGGVEGQSQPEQLPALPAGTQGQGRPQPDQGRAGVDGEAESDQPTPLINRPAKPGGYLNNAANTPAALGEVRGRFRGGGGVVFGDAGRGGIGGAGPDQLRVVNPASSGADAEINWAAIADHWSDQPSESLTRLVPRRGG